MGGETDDEEYKELLLPNETPESEEEAHSSSSYTVEEAIEKMGFGMFQIKMLALCGTAWMADSMEMSILAILGPAVRCEWQLTHWHEAFLTTVVFIGMFLSTYFWGYMSDTYGRKTVVIFASIGIFYYGLISSISPRYIWIVIFRGMVGFSMSGVVQGTTLITEYLPTRARGLTISFSSFCHANYAKVLNNVPDSIPARNFFYVLIFWSVGTSIEVLTAMYVMPNLGWRWQLFFSSLPSLIFLSIAKFLPESARFYVASGQREKALEMLEAVAKANKKELPQGKLIGIKTSVHRGSMFEMFRGNQWKTTVLLWILWFGSHFNIYGLALLTTSLYSSGYTCYGSSPIPGENIKDCDYCKTLDKHDYLNFFFVLTADFLCVVIVACLADTIGRKRLQGVGFIVMGLFYSFLFICTHSKNWTTFFLFGARCFAAVADLGGYIYTPEVYPTHIRGIALGSCSGISRIGCMLTPFVAQVLAHKYINLTIAIYVGISLTGFVCSLLLPIETKGRQLVEAEE